MACLYEKWKLKNSRLYSFLIKTPDNLIRLQININKIKCRKIPVPYSNFFTDIMQNFFY